MAEPLPIGDLPAWLDAACGSAEWRDSSGNRTEEHAAIGFWELDLNEGKVRWNAVTSRLHGLDPNAKPALEELLDCYVPESRSRLVAALGSAVREGAAYELELQLHTKGEPRRWVRAIGYPDSEAPTLRGTFQEVTESKRLFFEMLVRTAALEQSLSGFDIINDRMEFVYANRAYLDMWGYDSLDEIMGTSPVGHCVDPGVPRRIITTLRQHGRGTHEFKARRKDGSTFDALMVTRLFHDADGRDVYTGTVLDISERKQMERALRDSEARLSIAQSIAKMGSWEWDLVEDRFYFSDELFNLLGLNPAQGEPEPDSFFSGVHPDDAPELRRLPEKFRASTGPVKYDFRMEIDGKMRHISGVGRGVRDASGVINRAIGTSQDMTERRQLEDRLHQSQKMEAVGQLAGGVAHDFNNILTVITLQAELAAADDALSRKSRQMVEEIRASAERASGLTRQLLAFSRRQVLQIRRMELNDAVGQIARMLQRLLGEQIRLDLKLADNELVTRCDPVLLDQMILNLAVNARDAMPHGGRLRIETGTRTIDGPEDGAVLEASPGPYVWIAVEDTGCGIEPGLITKIFEPFFTTKELGKGTGLGLSTVFGIAKQHKAQMRLKSDVGKGTRFEIALPALEGDARDERPRPSAKAVPGGGNETILLVEDEQSVRQVVRTMLEGAGYHVIEAPNGVDALRKWQDRGKDIDLLMTDVVMPGGISGRDLALKVQEAEPKLRVIYTSGYTPESVGGELGLGDCEAFIQKPYTPRRLLDTVRKTLDCC